MSRRTRRIPLPRELEPLARLIEDLGRTYETSRVFFDFVEMSALSIANSCDLAQKPAREERYLHLIKQYRTLEERRMFPAMMAELVGALERTEQDVLGPISAALGLCSQANGQVWTPWSVSYMMAKMSLHPPEQIAEQIKRHGFMTFAEPACGPGGMILAFAQAFQEAGFNPQQQLHVTAVDRAPWCVHMSFVQCALSGIPAVIVLGDSLAGTEREHWRTPMHFWRQFPQRLAMRSMYEAMRDVMQTGQQADMPADAPPEPAPPPAAPPPEPQMTRVEVATAMAMASVAGTLAAQGEDDLDFGMLPSTAAILLANPPYAAPVA